MRHFVHFHVLAFASLLSKVTSFHSHSAYDATRNGHFEVCIDYGSSGPKVFWCPSSKFFEHGVHAGHWPPEMVATFKDQNPQFAALGDAELAPVMVDKAIGGGKIEGLKGGGSFGRLVKMEDDELIGHLITFFKTNFPTFNPDGTNSFILRICRATAGNRFGRLKNDQLPGWAKFNAALETLGIVPDKDGACKTIPGTMEATFEYYLSKAAFEMQDVSYFVGIGGASMQMGLTGVGCPEEKGWSEKLQVGGDGASSDEDYCVNFKDGSLWSFLSDRGDTAHWEAEGFSDMHMVGGMDESVLRFWYSRLKAVNPKKFKMSSFMPFVTTHGEPAVHYVKYRLVQSHYVNQDSMMKFWRDLKHGYGCASLQLGEGSNVAILSNMQRFVGQHLAQLQQIVRKFDENPQSVHKNSYTGVEENVWQRWVVSLLNSSQSCGGMIRDYISYTDPQSDPNEPEAPKPTSPKPNFISKMNGPDGKSPNLEALGKFEPGNLPFFCGADVYRIGLLEDIIGVQRDQAGEHMDCYINNLRELVGLGRAEMKLVLGDWMNGYLIWETNHGGAQTANSETLSAGQI